ncbi:exodeoxyribonuclease VII large subunit [Uliginosibacterium sp. 31-16]|uniref:exodeoxyribonuclease VII large subunit n=1 Tax=Uliginosibacterium sp. 31-16 TaxID=3068315 RepID=UPI00273EAAEB|nr:exodeoxyribonuclease VII large subunit [Uliginosibacterium sp. 31-16]MDP5240464.1 exodeoxyribonuclease VII large subunit [Uliginosibacterium sp. 31-16]
MFTGTSHAERVSTRVSSVSEFVLQIRQLIERSTPLGWIGGELSNLVRATSGHVYFTLKDERAQIRCTMWRTKAQLLPFQLQEGMRVEVRAQATVYEARGDLQLSVESIRRAGLGNLYEAFLRLKAALEAEGLFAESRKRPIPELPHGIGLITSPAAAALRDVITTLRRRAPSLPITLYPTPVQGDAAGEQIAAAIRSASQRARKDGIDVLLVCRGGGSIEDLWAFNHEAVARAIVASSVPVICGVGHETDTTLADFAADLRAPTPTAAAEIASAGWYALRQRLPQLHSDLQRASQRRLLQTGQRLDELQRRLTHPRARLARSAERLSALHQRLRQAGQTRAFRLSTRVDALAARLSRYAPRTAPLQARLQACEQSMARSAAWRLASARQHLASLAARLEALNPDAVLARGYAIVRSESGDILRDATAASDGERLDIQLAASRLKARVEKP